MQEGNSVQTVDLQHALRLAAGENVPYVSVRVDTFMTSGFFDPLPPCHVQISRKLVTFVCFGGPQPTADVI